MKKCIKDFKVVENQRLHPLYSLLRLTPVDGTKLDGVKPGQFVQVAIDKSKNTYLRRPISINNVIEETNELWLLVRKAGDGTASLMETPEGEIVNLILPLGNEFNVTDKNKRVLLIGGGVGVAPMLLLGKKLKSMGVTPDILIGARSKNDLLELDAFREIGNLHISTDDGSAGEHGVVTMHSVFMSQWDKFYCCGPSQMMKAVAAKARETGTDCEVSLENMMACGLGACLCCVEKTVKGNVCVCTEGPVFNINDLTW